MASRGVYKLIIRNLPFTVSHQELGNHFAKFGQVLSSRVMFDFKTGLSLKYGFVEFTEASSAEKALKQNRQFLDGHYMEVQAANQR